MGTGFVQSLNDSRFQVIEVPVTSIHQSIRFTYGRFQCSTQKSVSKESIQNCITQINIYIDNNADALSVHNHSNVNANTHTDKRSNQ